jgi:hypothetical protein
MAVLDVAIHFLPSLQGYENNYSSGFDNPKSKIV